MTRKMKDRPLTLPQPGGLAKRPLYLLGGHLFFGVGFVGMFLPVLPTTVFWIVAAICYAKSSPERYQRLVERGRAGRAVKNYLDHGVISKRGKWMSIIGMSLSALLLWLLPIGDLATVLGLSGIGIGALFVLTRPSAIAEHADNRSN